MEVVCLVYGVPSLVLTLFFLKFLNRSEFKYSFYRALQCDIVLNVMCYLNGWFIRFCEFKPTVPMMLAVFENFYPAFQFTSFCVNFYFNAQAMSILFMSVHRLSSSKFVKANEFWTKFYLPLYVAIMIISLILALIVYLGEMVKPKTYNYNLKMFLPVAAEPSKTAILTTMFFAESLTYFITILVVNILTIIVIHNRFHSTSEKTQKLMRSLTKIAFINSSLYFVVFIWQMFGARVFGIQFFLSSMYILSDSLSLSLPYILLAFDRNVRTTLGSIVGGRAALLAKNLGNNATRTSGINII
uniref:Serpentine receptor class gamma n=1 Tax=Caenorhabditis tropicalis TaxID=1561998 RepID=A0A1I7SZ13_9PELO